MALRVAQCPAPTRRWSLPHNGTSYDAQAMNQIVNGRATFGGDPWATAYGLGMRDMCCCLGPRQIGQPCPDPGRDIQPANVTHHLPRQRIGLRGKSLRSGAHYHGPDHRSPVQFHLASDDWARHDHNAADLRHDCWRRPLDERQTSTTDKVIRVGSATRRMTERLMSAYIVLTDPQDERTRKLMNLLAQNRVRTTPVERA